MSQPEACACRQLFFTFAVSNVIFLILATTASLITAVGTIVQLYHYHGTELTVLNVMTL